MKQIRLVLREGTSTRDLRITRPKKYSATLHASIKMCLFDVYPSPSIRNSLFVIPLLDTVNFQMPHNVPQSTQWL